MPSAQLLTDATARCEDEMRALNADSMFMRAGRSDGLAIGGLPAAEASATATSQIVIDAPLGEMTEKFDPIACLDDRVRRGGPPAEAIEPGRYIEIGSPDQTLLLELTTEVIHIGRGVAADLRLDDSSVSRRHALLVSRPSGPRILDDRSSNGTFVNGRRIEQFDLRNGDVIALGRVVLRYREVIKIREAGVVSSLASRQRRAAQKEMSP